MSGDGYQLFDLLEPDRNRRLVVQDLINEVAAGLVDFFDSEQRQWPYEVTERARRPTPSCSTNAMVCYVLGVLYGHLEDSRLAEGVESRVPDKDGWTATKSAAAVARLHDLVSGSGEVPTTTSDTFGDADPFSLYWLRCLLGPAAVDNAARATANRVIEHPGKAILRYSTRRHAPIHALPLIRAIQLGRAVGTADPNLRQLRDWFYNRLLCQLSYIEIRDSSFDIGEAIFSLEGLTVTDGAFLVTAGLMERVAGVIVRTQDLNPGLRPSLPFMTTAQGAVHVPLGVEVSSSLLRSCLTLDKRPGSQVFEAMNDVFVRYVDWLESTKRHVQDASNLRTYVGWQSEFVSEQDPVIHTWQSALIVLFLAQYDAALAKQMARTARRALHIRPASEDPSMPDTWSELEASREAMLGVDDGSMYRTLRGVREAFLGEERHGSFLLYGPPGTGKTTIAEMLAKELGWPLYAIGPSDFVVGGAEQVEARAKVLFDALELQANAVILFDEIDRLLLDRNSAAYGAQGDLFQFMTPGMLTKLKALRSRRHSIFCIATNYAWRIDRAITRSGRIDYRFLVLPPDLERRKGILNDLLGDELRLEGGSDAGAAITPFYTFLELKDVVRHSRKQARRGTVPIESFKEACALVRPAIDITPYRLEIKDRRGQIPGTLVEEYLLLRYLQVEARDRGGHPLLANEVDDWCIDRREEVRDERVRERVLTLRQ